MIETATKVTRIFIRRSSESVNQAEHNRTHRELWKAIPAYLRLHPGKKKKAPFLPGHHR